MFAPLLLVLILPHHRPFKRNEFLARIRSQLGNGEWGRQGSGGRDMSEDGEQLSGADMKLGSCCMAGIAAQASLLPLSTILTKTVPDVFPLATFPPVPLLESGEGNLASYGELGRAASSSCGDRDAAGERVILCVDDDEVSQVVLQGMLRSQQYRYLKAKSGAEGLALVMGGPGGGGALVPPDLVLLDCSLPDLSGFDVVRRIRSIYQKVSWGHVI